jgi:hypothetical protein
MIAARISLLIAIALTFALSCLALTPAKEKGAAHIVKMFNVFCLSQLPDLEGVKKAAGFGEFAPITGDELKAHAATEPGTIAEALSAWRFHDAGGEFILTATRSRLDHNSRKVGPEHVNAKLYACTLTYPPADPRQVLAELTALLKRPPDPPGHGIRFVWTHTTPKHLSRVELPGPDGRKLSASVLVKP